MFCFGLFVMWCQAAEPAMTIDTFCAAYEPVYWSARDTRRTKEQVDINNRKWKAVCGGKK